MIARAHHGSVSKEQRAQIEADLKSGQLPCVVATSSLELGIDMGAVDVVVQVEAPPSVASGLQRVGRAGHQVGATSRGVFFPNHRGDLIESAVVVERMRLGAIEEVAELRNPLDVLAQQIVAVGGRARRRKADELYALVRRASSFRDLPRSAFEAVLDMLSGRYPSEDFAELRPRLVWQRDTGVLTGPARRPAAGRHLRRHHPRPRSVRRLPGRRGQRVRQARARPSGRRARRGDGLRDPGRATCSPSARRAGGSSRSPTTRCWSPPPRAVPGRLPFWKGDSPSRPLELGRAFGGFVRELGAHVRRPAPRRGCARPGSTSSRPATW